jgi:hypothetical protein
MTRTATGGLTRAEDAYAHLASFAKGDVVDLSGDGFFQPGTVVAPQEMAGGIEDAFLFVRGCGAVTAVRVADLLEGTFTITLQNEAARGNVRYFDPAGYAAQNG